MSSTYPEPEESNSHPHSLILVPLNTIRRFEAKLTVKFNPEQTAKDQRGNRGIALLFL